MTRQLHWIIALSLAASGCMFDSAGYGVDEDDSAEVPGTGLDDGHLPNAEIICYYGEGSESPLATIEHVMETFEGVEAVHVRLTLDPLFVDNTYGETAIGWAESKKGQHTFEDLYKSDHAELAMYDGDGETRLEIDVDYLSEDAAAPSGFACQGVKGGDGEVRTGDPGDILGADSSLSRNLNERGHDSYTVDSPTTDAAYTPDPLAEDWDYRVVYEVWVMNAAFGDAGFGAADIDLIHASPAKGGDNTIIVEPMPCPPEDDCTDPDGCDPRDPGDPGDPGDCVEDSDCPTGEFCTEEGACLPVVP